MSSGSGSLSRYILVRLLLVIPMMWVLLTVVFFLLRVAPGDPVSAALGGRLERGGARRRARSAGPRPAADRAVPRVPRPRRPAQLRHTPSPTTARSLDLIRDQGGATLTLTVGAFLFALLIGLPLGRLAGRYRDSGGRRR